MGIKKTKADIGIMNLSSQYQTKNVKLHFLIRVAD
jgi:hypothetical protein